MPPDYWFTWALICTAGLYGALGVIVVLGRIVYDRRRLLFLRIAKLEAGAAESPGRHAALSRWFHRAAVHTIERGLAEMRAPEPVLRACATYVVAQVGESRLQASASSTTRRWRRIAALRTLAFSGSEAAWPLLEQAVEDADPEIVWAAVVTLGHLRGRRSTELLVKALRTVRQGRSQIAAFLETRPDISDFLWLLFADPSPILRYWGATLAGRAPGLESQLIALTRDPDPSVRKAAINSLGTAGCTGAGPIALGMLDDPVPFVRAYAARALGRLGTAELAPALAAKMSDPDWSTRYAAKRALESLGPEVEAAVLEHLSDDDEFARNSAAEVLQNLGTFERLLSAEAMGPSDPRRLAWLRKLAAAGGLRVWDAVLANLPLDTRMRVAVVLRGLERQAAGEAGSA